MSLHLLIRQLPPNGEQRATHDGGDGQLLALQLDAALLHASHEILCFVD